MIGSITKALIESLRASELVSNENISVVIEDDNGEGIVNTALPAIAISVKNSETGSGQFIGGMLQNQYRIQLAVITALDNIAGSPDEDHQYEQLDLAYKVMLYLYKVQHSEFFKKLMEGFDFALAYRGTETEQTRGMANELEDIRVNIQRLQYEGTIISKEIPAGEDGATLEDVNVICGCINT